MLQALNLVFSKKTTKKELSENRHDNERVCIWWWIEADIVYFRNGFHDWRSGMCEDLLEQLPNTPWWSSIVVVFTVRSEIYQPGTSLFSTNSCWLSSKTLECNSASPFPFVWLTFLGSEECKLVSQIQSVDHLQHKKKVQQVWINTHSVQHKTNT